MQKYRPSSSGSVLDGLESKRNAITSIRAFLRALNVEKMHVELGQLHTERYDLGSPAYFEELPFLLEQCLEEMLGLKMFRIMDDKWIRDTPITIDVKGPRQKVFKHQDTRASDASGCKS